MVGAARRLNVFGVAATIRGAAPSCAYETFEVASRIDVCRKRASRALLGKDRSPRHSRRSIASAKLASPPEAEDPAAHRGRLRPNRDRSLLRHPCFAQAVVRSVRSSRRSVDRRPAEIWYAFHAAIVLSDRGGQREVALQRLARFRIMAGQGERRHKGHMRKRVVIRIDRDRPASQFNRLVIILQPEIGPRLAAVPIGERRIVRARPNRLVEILKAFVELPESLRGRSPVRRRPPRWTGPGRARARVRRRLPRCAPGSEGCRPYVL